MMSWSKLCLHKLQWWMCTLEYYIRIAGQVVSIKLVRPSVVNGRPLRLDLLQENNVCLCFEVLVPAFQAQKTLYQP